jgi:hypothetical protein
VVIAAAGDISCAPDPAGVGSEERNSPVRCQDAATADLVSEAGPDAVLTLGDHQYPNASIERFRGGYDRTWGRFKEITHPAVGNHEYGTRAASGYFDYFGPAAGDPATGYYSFDLGAWHLVVLNSECKHLPDGCGAASRQAQWLRDDLTAHPSACTLAYWHEPRYSNGHHGPNDQMVPVWDILQAAGADVVLSGHDHDYERFAPMNSTGRLDPVGLRSFVVGTGGDSFYRLHVPDVGREVGIETSPGILRMELTPDSYSWQFRTVGATPDGNVADSGQASCQGPPGAPN